MATKHPVEEQDIDQQWRLEKEKELVLSNACKNSLGPERCGAWWYIVVYDDGGLGVGGVNESQDRKVQGVFAHGVSVLRDGRFVERGREGRISLYSQTWKEIKAAEFECFEDTYDWFSEITDEIHGGIDVDENDHIYVGGLDVEAIRVFTPEGGAPVKKIPCPGYRPDILCTMNHSEILVLSDGLSVRVVDREGKVMSDVSNNGFYARVVLLHDDNILIGWLKLGRVNIDLYTNQLRLVRRVLADYRVDLFVYDITEFSTGEIALCDRSKLHIFRQTRDPHTSVTSQ